MKQKDKAQVLQDAREWLAMTDGSSPDREHGWSLRQEAAILAVFGDGDRALGRERLRQLALQRVEPGYPSGEQQLITRLKQLFNWEGEIDLQRALALLPRAVDHLRWRQRSSAVADRRNDNVMEAKFRHALARLRELDPDYAPWDPSSGEPIEPPASRAATPVMNATGTTPAR